MAKVLKTAKISEGNLPRLFAGGGAMGRRRLMTAALAAVFAASSVFADTWTFQRQVSSFAGGPADNYNVAGAWKDENGVSQTFDENATEARTYLVPAGKTLISKQDSANAWRFTQNDDTFVLEGSSSAPAILASSTKELTIPHLVMKDNSRFVQAIQADVKQKLLGSIHVNASEDYPAQIWGWGWAGRAAYISTTITGSGSLVYTEHLPGGDASGARGAMYFYDCDASGFTGPFTMKIPDGVKQKGPPYCYINASKNIGGNPAAFMQKGLTLAGVYLELQGNVTLPVNRGLYIGAHTCENADIAPYGARIGVAGSRTLTVTTPVAFESADFGLNLSNGSGAFSLPGWTSNGTIALNTAMTLDITGARVANGTVTPALIGTLTRANTSSKVKLSLSGDGSELAEGRYTILSAVSLPANIDSFLTVVDTGAFTLPAGKKAMYSSEGGTRIVLTVKDDCSEWTLQSSGSGGVSSGKAGKYLTESAWKDKAGASQTWSDASSASVIDYFIPSGMTMGTVAGDVDETDFSIYSNADSTLTLRDGTESSRARFESAWINLTVPSLVMGDSSEVFFWAARNAGTNFRHPRRISGNLRIEAAETAPARFTGMGYFIPQVVTNAMTMTGSGGFLYTRDTRNQSSTFVATGDNSGFTGPLSVNNNGSDKGMFLNVSSCANIGGDPSEFKEKGLELWGATLLVQGDTALTPNRGFYVSSNATVNVGSGKTFSVPSRVGFAMGGWVLTKEGAGTMLLSNGWADIGTVKVTTGTLEITGASVTNGVVTPASIGSLVVSGGAVKIVVTGDGSEVNLGDVKTLIDCGGTLDDGVADYLQFVNDGAFTFAPGTKASLYIEDGKVKMSVVEYVPEWTLNTNDRAYTTASVWTDETGTHRTWTAETAATKIEYFVPAGLTAKTPDGGLSTDLYAISTHPDSTVTVRSGGCFQSNVMYAHVPNLVLESGATLHFWIANNTSAAFRSARSVAGTLHIEAPESNPAVIMSRGHFSDPVRTNAMDMVGSGAVYYTRYSGAGTDGIFYATGDNSGFTGPLAVKDAASKTDKRMFLHVSSSENIGGNPEAYTEKGFELHSAQLMVHGDVALGSNRGFYVSSNSVVNVDSGKSFTSPNAVVFTEGTTLSKTGAGTMSVPGWTSGTVAVNAGALNLVGATFANGAAETPVAIGGIEYAGGATVTLTVTGDGSELPFANATNVLIEAESALPAGFAGKVRVVNDNAFTVPSRLKTKFVVVDGTKLVLETEKRKGTVLIVR